MLARAAAEGRSEGIVLIAARTGATTRLVDRIAHDGGVVLARFDDVDYIRARLPLAKFDEISCWPDVAALHIDAGGGEYAVDQGTDPEVGNALLALAARSDVPADSNKPSPPPLAYERFNPLAPSAEVGMQWLLQAHPRFDGRGVTIGLVSRGAVFDVAHPAFDSALDLHGVPVRKIVGIVDPRLFSPDAATLTNRSSLLTSDTLPDEARVGRRATVHVADSTFRFDNTQFRAPHAGTFSIGSWAAGVAEPSERYTVIWDSSGAVWLDTDKSHDFTRRLPLRDVNRDFRVDSLPPATSGAAWRHLIVAVDSGEGAVHVYVADNWHETMVASTAAGSHILGGHANGIAPAARLVVVRGGSAMWQGIEAFIRAERDPRIDVLTASANWGAYPIAGESIFSLVIDRAIRRYGKPVFAGAQNNGPAHATVGEPAAAPDVIAVGAMSSAATLAALFGWRMSMPDVVLGYSSRGPSRAGGLKPDVVAPALWLVADACSEGTDNVRTKFAIPICWQLGKGSSNASPVGAGVAAVLLSAARQTGVPCDAARLAWALRFGARPLLGYEVAAQGHGVLDVVHAWSLLSHQATGPTALEVHAPVVTRLSRELSPPGDGWGLYEREGWTTGARGIRVLRIERRSGPATGGRYRLRWVSNDGTFSAPAWLTLPRDRSVELPVTAHPRAPGLHAAILQFVDPVTNLPVADVSCVIVATTRFSAQNGYTVRLDRSVPFPMPISLFVNVPPGAELLRMSLAVRHGRVKLRTEDSQFGADLEGQSYSKAYEYPSSDWTYTTSGHTGVELFPHPRPGVWELIAEPFDEPDHDNPMRGRDEPSFHEQGSVSIAAQVVRADSAATRSLPSGDVVVQWHTALGAPLRDSVIVSAAHRDTGALRMAPLSLSKPRSVVVDSGSSWLRVQARVAGGGAGLGMSLFDCTRAGCRLWDVTSALNGAASLMVRRPGAGRWSLVFQNANARPVAIEYAILTMHAATRSSREVPSEPRRPGGLEARMDRLSACSGQSSHTRGDVAVVDVIDVGSERAEQEHPLAVFGALPFRPVVVGTAVVPCE